MKAAAFPVNFWLPASYHTPRIVVSALFAGLLTKVGIYALIRVLVMLLPVERGNLSLLIAIVGAATMISGALGALAESDVRRIFGYVVISGIGNMLAGIALGSVEGVGGSIFYALHSIVLMTALYMAAGQAARLGGSFVLSDLSGLWRQNYLFAGLSLILFLAASGLPPFSGFWPKVILVKAALDSSAWWLAGTILFTGFLTTIAFSRVFLFAYWRPANIQMRTSLGAAATPNPQVTWQAGLPLLLLTTLVVGFGIFPEALLRLTQLAAADLLDPTAYLHSVFPGGAS
jgi:multicomponent Na+:H+ antiporter subunit D